MFEAFADRAYLADGQLAPRRLSGAVHHDPTADLSAGNGDCPRRSVCRLSTASRLQLRADSLCVHGDNADALAVLRRLRAQLDTL